LLQDELRGIKFDSDEDEGAHEWYSHVSDTIADLAKNKLSVKEAEDSLGMRLS